MKILIVATCITPSHIQESISSGHHYRIEYLELSHHLRTPYVDYAMVGDNQLYRRLEQGSRMDIRLAWRVKKLVEREHYDAVFSLSERVGLPLAAMLKSYIKQVVVIHHPMSAPKQRLMKLLRVADYWRKMIAISEVEASALRDMFHLTEERATNLKLPVDIDFFKPSCVEIPLDQQDHFQSLGLSHRDYPILLHAMQKLPAIHCHLRIGSTWVAHDAGFSKDDVPANVTIQPYVNPGVLRECYARSRFTVVPLLNDTQWTAGAVTVQLAQAMGKAVIASDRPGLSTYIKDGETGLLVRTGDTQDLADAIEYLWKNPDKAQAIGSRAREWAVDNYAMDKWVHDITAILQSA